MQLITKMRKGRPKSTGLLTERVMRTALNSGHLNFSPFSLQVEWLPQSPDTGFDGLLHVRWDPHGVTLTYGFQVKTHWTSLALQQFARRVRTGDQAEAPLRPMIILPYLSEPHLAQLQEHGLSGIDLCGNGLLLDPPRHFVLRMGAKSRFPTTNATPSIYHSQNISSLVARIFLLTPRFLGVNAVHNACRDHMMRLMGEQPALSLPTVSKALTVLEHDLVILRKGRALALTDPARLLEGLERSFQPPVTTSTHLGKTDLSATACWDTLRSLGPALRVVSTGRGSAVHYTGLAGPERLQVYVSDLQRAREALRSRETVAFPNVELLETTDEAAYFDARENNGVLWASPLQTYLELSRASPRERDVATNLRKTLLRNSTSTPS